MNGRRFMKKILLFATAAMMVAMCAGGAWAASYTLTKTAGIAVNYNDSAGLNTNWPVWSSFSSNIGNTATDTLTITGSAALTTADWDAIKTVLNGVTYAVEIVMNNGSITTMDYGLTGSPGVRKISFPSGVTSIASSAFVGCTNLTTVDLTNVTNLGNGAFANTGLSGTVTIPASLTTIGTNPFYDCGNLQGFTVDASNPNYYADDTTNGGVLVDKKINTHHAIVSYPGGRTAAYTSASDITDVAYRAFRGSKVTSVSLPHVTALADEAFYNCDSLVNATSGAATISMPLVTTVGKSAFENCSNLEAIYLPKATDIYESAFKDCVKLAVVNFPVAGKIYDFAFENCYRLSNVNLPAATDIGAGAFMNCAEQASPATYGLKSITLPAATNIKQEAFKGCTFLESVSLPKVAVIGVSVFEECVKLANVALGTGLPASGYPNPMKIYEDAFKNCESLKNLNFPHVMPEFGSIAPKDDLAALDSVFSGTASSGSIPSIWPGMSMTLPENISDANLNNYKNLFGQAPPAGAGMNMSNIKRANTRNSSGGGGCDMGLGFAGLMLAAGAAVVLRRRG